MESDSFWEGREEELEVNGGQVLFFHTYKGGMGVGGLHGFVEAGFVDFCFDGLRTTASHQQNRAA